MQTELERARRLARELEGSILDPDLGREAARILNELAQVVETQQTKLSAAVMALNYYRDPSLYYCDDRPPGAPILDEGLRARTALRVISEITRRPLPRRTPLPQSAVPEG